DQGERGEMHHRVEWPRGEHAAQRFRLPDPAVDELRPGRDRPAVATAQVVEHHDPDTRRHELLDDDTPDVARPAGDGDLPRHSPCSRWKSLRSASTSR